MPSLPKNVTLFCFGFLGLASLASVSSLALTADSLAGLRTLTIQSNGDFVIDPGERLIMTAQGDYGTYTVPMRAAWSIVSGEDLGYFFETCDAAKACEFVAGSAGGDVRIHAETSGMTDEEVIHIRPPTPAKPVVSPFTDALPDWAGEPIVTLNESGIIRGYDDGRYGAGDLLTRGQLITILERTLKALYLVHVPSNCRELYNDVPPDHYAYEAACVLRAGGYLDSLSTLNPDDTVTRGETASLLNRVTGPAFLSARNLRLNLILSGGPYFDDVPENSTYYGDTAVVRSIGLMNGNPDGMFQPGKTLNRAEAATIFFRLMKEVKQTGVAGL